MRLTSVVVTYGHGDEIAACLDALLASDVTGGHEVVVVDNASTDHTASVLRTYADRVRVVELPANVGYARANNHALSLATGSLVALVNPDCLPDPDALELLCRHLEAHPGIGTAAAMLRFPDGRRQLFARREPTLAGVLWDLTEPGRLLDRRLRGSRGSRHRRYEDEFGRAEDGAFAVDCPAAACVVLWRPPAGDPLFDEQFPLLFNDTDLYRRMREDRGLEHHVVPRAGAVHLQGTSLNRLDRDRLRAEFMGSQLLYARKHWSLSAAVAVRLLLAANALVCFALALLPRSHRQRLRAEARGDLGALGIGRTRPWLLPRPSPRHRAAMTLRSLQRRHRRAARALGRRLRRRRSKPRSAGRPC